MTTFDEALRFIQQQLTNKEILRYDVESNAGYRSIMVESDQGWYCAFNEYDEMHPSMEPYYW